MIIKFKKAVSLIVVNCFLLSFVYGQLIATAVSSSQSAQQYRQIFTDFMLPYSYGKITDAHFASTDRVVINIQDLHCHPKVQKNIADIIEMFDRQYGVKNIYLEGAYGDIDTGWISKALASDPSKKSEVTEKMLETGRLTGAEYFSAVSGRQIIKGLEKKEPYLDNLKRFGDILENKEKIDVILQAVKQADQKLKDKYYDRRQLKLEQLSKEYTQEKISAEKYYTLLSKHIDRLGIDIYKYDNTLNFMALIALQKDLKYTEISRQLQNLIVLLQSQLPSEAFDILKNSTNNFSKVDKLYGYLIKIARQYNLDLSVNFPELDKYFQYIELSQKVNPLKLLEENQKLTNEINSRFSRTKAQSEAVFLVTFEKYLKDYLTSKITSDDYVYYKQNIEKYKQLGAKYVDNKVLSLLDGYLAEADKFYEINTERNNYFTDNIFNEVAVSSITPKIQAKDDMSNIIENMSEVKRVDIIITGGFHTGTVSEILKNHNVSYIVITPNVTDGIQTAEDTYYKAAKEQSQISFQTLANLVTSLSPVDQKRVLAAADPELAAALGAVAEDARERILDNAQIKELADTVKMAEMLMSDDSGGIKQKIVESIKERLGANSKASGQVDADLVNYINKDKLQKAFEGTQNLEELIEYSLRIRNAKNDNVLNQSLEMLAELTEHMMFFVKELQKLASLERPRVVTDFSSTEKMAEASNKADLADFIFEELIGGEKVFDGASKKLKDEMLNFYNMAVMETVKTYFENLPVDRRRAYLDKNIAKTKKLFEKSKKELAKTIETKILSSREGLELFIKAKGYDSGKGYIQKIISDIISKGLSLPAEKIISIIKAEEENLLRFRLLQNTLGMTGIEQEYAEFITENAGLTLEEFKEKAQKEYGAVNDKEWNLELKKYEQENSGVSGEIKLAPGEEMHEASNKAAVTEQIFEKLIGTEALDTADEDLQDEMLVFFNETIMEQVNGYFESMSVSQRRKYLDDALFGKIKDKTAKNIEAEILGSYEGLEQFVKAKGYDAGQGYIQSIIENTVNERQELSPEEIIAKIEQKRENLLRFAMVQKTIGITGEEINNEVAKFVLKNSSLPIDKFKAKADKEFGGINETLWNKELKKYMQIKARQLPDLELPEYGLSQQQAADVSQIASNSKSYTEFVTSVGTKYGKKTLGISRTRQGRYNKGHYDKKHGISTEFGDCDGISGTWAQLNDQNNGIITYGSQDIKFHISASPENAKEIYDLVRPVLDKYNMTFKVAVNADKLRSLKNTQVGKFMTIYLPEEESLQVLVDLGLELDAVLSAYNKRNKSPEILNEIKLGSSGILTVRDEAMKRGVEKEKQTRALQFADFFNKSKDNMVQIWNGRTEAKTTKPAAGAEYNTQAVKKALDKAGVVLPGEYNLNNFVAGETIRFDLTPEEWADGVAGKLKSKLGLQSVKGKQETVSPEVRFALFEKIQQSFDSIGYSWAFEPENIDATMQLITPELLNSGKPVDEIVSILAGELDMKKYGAADEVDFMKMLEEELSNIGKTKTDNQTSSSESLIKESVNPIPLITRTAVKIAAASEISDELAKQIKENNLDYDIKSNLIVTDNAGQAAVLRKQGFNAVSITVLPEKLKGKKGIIIGERDGRQIRAYLDKIKGELIFYSNGSNLKLQDIKTEELKEMFVQAQQDGINADAFKGIAQIVIADKASDIETIINGIKNARTDSITKPAVSINLDFSNRNDVNAESIEKISSGETNNGLDSNTIIVNAKQLETMNAAVINALQQKGYEVVVITSNIQEAEAFISGFHINGAVIKTDGQITKENLAKIKQIENSNIKDGEIIKTQMYVEGLSDENLTQLGDIYSDYGILPIVSNKSAYLNTNQKCSVRITDKDVITDILANSSLASIITDKVTTVKQSTGRLSDIISDILKPATPKQKFVSEIKAVRSSEYEFEIAGLAEAVKNKDGLLFKLLTGEEWFKGEQETENEEMLKDSINKLLAEGALKGLAKDRVSKLIKDGKTYEALGCIRASAERTVESLITAKLKADNIEISADKFKKYSGGLLRNSIMILGVQLLMQGKDIGVLMQDQFIDSNMTVQQYFESIMVSLNADMKDIVKLNEYRIAPLTDEQSTAKALANFKDLNILMQDRLREKTAVKDAKISLLAVRGILGSA